MGRPAENLAEVISTRAPHTGSDVEPLTVPALLTEFQSTLPARGATTGAKHALYKAGISIRAPRTESDLRFLLQLFVSVVFQSTLPTRGATKCTSYKRHKVRYFNPRSLYGERRAK